MGQLEFGDLNKSDTLRIERDRINREREEGTHCAACGQFCKIYPRQIHSTIARALIEAARSFRFEYFHGNDIRRVVPNMRGDFWKCAAWGLIEPKPSTEKQDNGLVKTGMWKMTEKGMRFVNRQIKIPRVVFVYDTNILGFSEDQVDVVDCLKKKFDYDELMGG